MFGISYYITIQPFLQGFFIFCLYKLDVDKEELP